MKVFLCFGPRPEAIKIAVLYHQRSNPTFIEVRRCVMGQPREMLDQVLAFFEKVNYFQKNGFLSNARNLFGERNGAQRITSYLESTF